MAGTREDRRVRIVFVGSAGKPVDPATNDFRSEALVLMLPKKAAFPTDSDSEAEFEALATAKSVAPAASVDIPPAVAAVGHTDEAAADEAAADEAGAPDGESVTGASASVADVADAAEVADEAVGFGWCEQLQNAIDDFDRTITSRRLRGVEVALCTSGVLNREVCPPELLQALVCMLANRNHVRGAGLESRRPRILPSSDPAARSRGVVTAASGSMCQRPSCIIRT